MSDDQVTLLRDARKWFNDGQCCGQVDSAGICAAPACIFGEALKEFSQAADRIEKQAAEITRLRAELATARLVPPLNPDRWRGAINDALTNWLDTIHEEDVPKDALRRLIKYEVDAALDPAVSQDAAALAATARREGMEEAAKIAEECQRQNGPLSNLGFPERYRAGLAAGAQAIAAAIRAAAKEGKP